MLRRYDCRMRDAGNSCMMPSHQRLPRDLAKRATHSATDSKQGDFLSTFGPRFHVGLLRVQAAAQLREGCGTFRRALGTARMAEDAKDLRDAEVLT